MTTNKAAAQSITSGDITGRVTYATGGVLVNAAITLTNAGTNAVEKAITNQLGTYRFAFLRPGTYGVSVEAVGFQPQRRAGIVVTAGEPTAVDLRMQVAGLTQAVESAFKRTLTTRQGLAFQSSTAAPSRPRFGLKHSLS
ncbi:MAG: carboxypeptidase-like regulatory domain-containing protein [Bryobacteraceae bacterium]|jgi:hypothetical protein